MHAARFNAALCDLVLPQGSIIVSAAEHGHYCNASKCWSAGWRECARTELRYQIWSSLLAGARGLMFYRLGIEDAPLNHSYVGAALLPALDEVAPHLAAIMAGKSGLVALNVSEAVAVASLYRRPSGGLLLVALRWAQSGGGGPTLGVRMGLGRSAAGATASRLDAGGKVVAELRVGAGGLLADGLASAGTVNVYTIS